MKIDAGIPMLKEESRGRPNKYPFGKMRIGDSFMVSEGDENLVRCSANGYGNRHSMKFSVRKYEGGYRCWRVS